MIPTIEQIIEDLLAGTCSKQDAIRWLYQHADGSANEDRKMFAAFAMQGLLTGGYVKEAVPALAVRAADELIAALKE